MRYGNLFEPFSGKENVGDDDKKQFLISVAYRNMIRKMVIGLTGNHKLTVGILPESSPDLAFTDGRRIMINTLHKLFSCEPIDDITKYCLALAVHESLHPIYSCFQCIEDAARKRVNETDTVVMVRRNVFNILEDARIERIGRFKFPGVSYAIEDLNEYLYTHTPEHENANEIDVLMQMLLDFVSVDKIKRALTGDLADVWDKIVPLALKAKYSDTCSDCYRYTKKIMSLLKRFIPENEDVESPSQKPDNIVGSLQDINAGTGEIPGTNSGIKVLIVSEQQSGQNAGSAAGTGTGAGAGEDNGSGENSTDARGKPVEETNSLQKEDNGLLAMLIQALNISFGEHIQDQGDDAFDQKVAADIQEMAANDYHIDTMYGDYDCLEAYVAIKADVAPVTQSLKKGLKNILNYNTDEMSRYLHSGRIDSKSLGRIPTGAICAKRVEKSDETDLNITVLTDLSGSMNGIRLESAKKACIVLQEVCRSIKIPISILGFKESSRRRAKILHFGDPRLRGKFAYTGIVRMTASGGTPLGESLMYLPRFLKKQQEEDKLVIVITDGEPNGGPGLSKAAVTEVSKTAKVYGLAIGEGRANLAAIFGARYIAIDSLDKLPRELCKIIEKNLFRR